MPSRPARYAVIGNPVAHSRSPAIHAMFAQAVGHAIEYDRLAAPVDGFVAAVDAFRADGGRGLNVTLPFKPQAFAYARRHTPRAAVAGAVNTLAFDGDDVLGDNTDGPGLVADIEGRIGLRLAGARLLLLGAGGASRGVVMPLLAAGLEHLSIANRTVAKAVALRDELASRLDPNAAPRLTAGALDAIAGGYDVIVNATAAGLADTAPALPDGAWRGAVLALDMVYGARPTPFMAAARAAGCARVEDGLGMLVEQAAESFALWRGVRPQTASVFAALRERLARDT
ncbi:MAG: shikimate dehydrogenase [Burkholderiaceae bacterium]